MAITHTFTSGKADGADGTLVQPSNWNANHTMDSEILVLVDDSTLTNRRIFTPRDMLQATDGGAGAAYDLDYNPLDVSIAHFRDEFITGSGGSGNWAGSGIGSSPTTAMQASTTPHLGVVRMTTSATSAQGGSYQLTQSSAGHFPLNAMSFDCIWIFQLKQTVTQTFRIGWTSQGAAAPSEFIGVRFDTTAGDTNFMGECRSSSTSTATSLAVAVDTGWHKVRMRSTTNGTILFSIDGGTEVSINTNVSGSNLWPAMILVTQAAVAASVWLDFFAFTSRGLTR